MRPKQTPKTVVQKVAPSWPRGRAWLDANKVVMDGAHAEFYNPLEYPVGFELTKVRTPDDAVAFVRRFGLLRTTWEEYRWEDLHTTRKKLPAPALVSESVEDFIREADDLRKIVAVIRDVRRGVAGDHAAVDRVRLAVFGEPIIALLGDSAYGPTADQALLVFASDWVARGLSQHFASARPLVFERMFLDRESPPGHLCIGIVPTTLSDVCFLQVAFAIADKEPLDVCPQCQRAFVVEDGRQRFCTPACANRARVQRFNAKHVQKKKKKKKKRPRHVAPRKK